MSGMLFVTWDGGGNVPPTLGLAAEATRRGHAVTILGHRQQAGASDETGAEFTAYDRVAPWDPHERRGSLAFALDYLRLFTDARFGREVVQAIERRRPDVVVVDALLPAAIAAAVASGVPTVVLVHTTLAAVQAMVRGPIGAVSALKRFSLVRGLGSADALLVVSPEALALPGVPAHAVHVGPVFGPGEGVVHSTTPGSRRILISLSTIHYAGMPGVLQKLVDAVGTVDASAVVTTGPTIEPGSLRRPRSVEIHRRLPHSELLADAGLVIGHGGHGTATKALSAGVPVLVRPLSSLGDHRHVARALEHAGVGRELPSRASTGRLAEMIAAALDDAPMHTRAASLGESLRGTDGARTGLDLVERVAATGGVRSRRGSASRLSPPLRT